MNLELSDIERGLMLRTGQGKRALKLALEGVKLLDRKQLDYGPNNILYSGEMGIVVRCQDKICRLRHLLEKGGDAQNESLEDSYRDLANYGIIGMMLHRGEWADPSNKPSEPPLN